MVNDSEIHCKGVFLPNQKFHSIYLTVTVDILQKNVKFILWDLTFLSHIRRDFLLQSIIPENLRREWG